MGRHQASRLFYHIFICPVRFTSRSILSTPLSIVADNSFQLGIKCRYFFMIGAWYGSFWFTRYRIACSRWLVIARPKRQAHIPFCYLDTPFTYQLHLVSMRDGLILPFNGGIVRIVLVYAFRSIVCSHLVVSCVTRTSARPISSL